MIKASLELKNLPDTFIENFKKEFRKQIIEKGLDQPLKTSVEELKVQLKSLINEQTRTVATVKTDNPTEEHIIDIPKSDAEILKYLSDGKFNLEDAKPNADHVQLASKIVIAQFSQGQKTAARVRLRMDIGQNETVEMQYSKAKEWFNQSIIGIPDKTGNIQYYLNPGTDLTRYLKIVCSTHVGLHEKTLKKYDRDTEKRGYAEWTLKQEALVKIQDGSLGFINLTEVMNQIKQGDAEAAVQHLNKLPKNEATGKINEKIENISKNKELTPGIQAYNEILSLIKNLGISKRISTERVVYSLTSEFNRALITNEAFFEQLDSSIRLWLITNDQIWVNILVEKVINLIKEMAK